MSVVNNLADQLFAEKPAKRQDKHFDINGMAHHYVNSRIFAASRGMHPLDSQLPIRLSNEAISDKVNNVEHLGPYEHQILASLLRAPHNFIVLTGSTGCGKTSTLRYVLEFYDENAVIENEDQDKGLLPNHVYVDFNKLDKEYSQHEENEKGLGLKFLYEKLPIRIAKALITSVKEYAEKERITPIQMLLNTAKEAYGWSVGNDIPNGKNFDWTEIMEAGDPVVLGKPDAEIGDLIKHVMDAAKGKISNFALGYFCGLLDALAIKTAQSGKETLLVLDNIDPLDDDTQYHLRRYFLGICQEKNFKVIMALRHSSFRMLRKSNFQTIEFNWYPHCGPSLRYPHKDEALQSN